VEEGVGDRVGSWVGVGTKGGVCKINITIMRIKKIMASNILFSISTPSQIL